MKTQCKSETFLFQTKTKRDLVAHFNGGLLLQQTKQITEIIKKFAGCFTDHRDADSIERTVEELLAQRIYTLALGYEDLNDHDELRNDPLLAVLAGKDDPTGTESPAWSTTMPLNKLGLPRIPLYSVSSMLDSCCLLGRRTANYGSEVVFSPERSRTEERSGFEGRQLSPATGQNR